MALPLLVSAFPNGAGEGGGGTLLVAAVAVKVADEPASACGLSPTLARFIRRM